MSDKKIDINDFPESYQDIVRVIGIDKAIELAKQCGGSTQYIPKLDTLFREARNQQIKLEFTGFNAQSLAIKYNLTEVQIRNIVNAKRVTIEDFLDEEKNSNEE